MSLRLYCLTLQHGDDKKTQGRASTGYLGHDELFQVHIITESHSARVNAKNSSFCFGVR